MKKDVFAVIGQPIWHSLSPLIYNTLFEIYNINSIYIPIELNKNNYEDFLKNFSSSINLCGLNVTMPLKEDVISCIDTLDDTSAFLGSVNTIDLKNNKGYTTDGKGFLLSLANNGVDIENKNIVLIGAGGASKSIAFELVKNKPSRLTIINRTICKADTLGKSLNSDLVHTDTLSNIGIYMDSCDLLINATNLGMGEMDFESLDFVDKLNPNAFVYDIIYYPRQTSLLKKAKEKGLKTSNGLDMLIYQAFYAFKIYTGIMPKNSDKNIIIEKIEKAQ